MLKVPMQTLFGAGLLLSLAFSVNDGSSASGESAPESTVRFACDESGIAPAPGNTADAGWDAGGCREANFR
jgi:hypothetical protein